jgi:hypothetical protein
MSVTLASGLPNTRSPSGEVYSVLAAGAAVGGVVGDGAMGAVVDVDTICAVVAVGASVAADGALVVGAAVVVALLLTGAAVGAGAVADAPHATTVNQTSPNTKYVLYMISP